MSDGNLISLFLSVLNEAVRGQRGGHWKADSRFAKARSQLQADSRGQMGENFVSRALQMLGHSVKHTQATDPQNKQWDLVVDDRHYWEVKTATMGRTTANFQHEHIYKERQYHGIVFVDIAPDDLYISFVPKHEIDWKNLHRRKDSSFYKWDFSKTKIESAKMKTLSDFGRGYDSATARIDAYLQKKKNPHDI